MEDVLFVGVTALRAKITALEQAAYAMGSCLGSGVAKTDGKFTPLGEARDTLLQEARQELDSYISACIRQRIHRDLPAPDSDE